MGDQTHERIESGHERLWRWFGLSYASFLTLPRILMHEMPDEWQGRMAELLEEWNEANENAPTIGFSVRATDQSGKLVKMPDLFSRAAYRHPNNCRAELDQIRGGSR